MISPDVMKLSRAAAPGMVAWDKTSRTGEMMRTALVHDWFLTLGGAERVLEQMAILYPEAPIYFVIMDPEVLPPTIRQHRLHETWIRRLPRARSWYKRYLPLMPWAIEDLDLSSYDLVLSDCSAMAKGVLTGANTLHVSYLHTPTRYLWDKYQEYRKEEAGPISRVAVSPFFSFLRRWDRLAADRPDVLVANSRAVKRRIRKHYRRDSVVVHPPVDVDRFQVGEGPGDYYLVLSRLVPYKRFDLAVQACTRLKRPLIVAGDGPDLPRLKKFAGPTVKFVGRVSDEEAARLMAGSRALLFPGEEDFGIIQVEVQAAGRPVVAYGRGGAEDTVVDGETGVLFHEQALDPLIAAMETVERQSWDGQRIRRHAEQFRPERFREQYEAVVSDALADFETSQRS
jgi:glycosyltransferase involved in cell wall biosynthesis